MGKDSPQPLPQLRQTEYKPGTVLHALGMKPLTQAEKRKAALARSLATRAPLVPRNPENKRQRKQIISGVGDMIPAFNLDELELTQENLRLEKMRGELDTWPIRGSPTESKYKVDSDFAAAVGDLSSVVVPAPKDACVKPALVKEMEAFLGTEMLLVDPEDTVGRIKVARELFTMFIARFDVYKDVLSAVRDEYDALLLKYQALAEHIQGSQTRTEMLEKKMAQQLTDMYEVAEKDKEGLRAKAAAAAERVQQSIAEVDSVSIELGQREAEIENHCQQKKELVEQLNRERLEAEDKAGMYEKVVQRLYVVEGELKEHQDNAGEQLRILRKNNGAMVQEIQSWRATVDDLEHQLIRKGAEYQKQQEEEKSKALTQAMAVKQLKATCATLQSENKRLAALAQRKDVWTPRPEFRDIASHTNDRLYYDPKQRTADVVKDLYKEIHRLADVIKEQDIKLKSCIKVMYFLDKPDLLEDTPAGGEHIACQPQNPALPKFMQVEGSVNNLWLTKPQTEEFVNQVWDFRKSEEERRGQTVALQQAFHGLLMQKFKAEHEALEFAYNIREGCTKFIWDADLEMFLRVLHGVVHHEIRDDQEELLSSLHSLFFSLDDDQRGWLGFKQVTRALTAYFSTKSKKQLILIKYRLSQDTEARDQVHYDRLFETDVFGNQGPFIEEVRDQHLREAVRYTQAVYSMIPSIAKKGMVLPSDVKQGFQKLDPLKPDEEINYYLHVGLGGRVISRRKRTKGQKGLQVASTHMHKGKLAQRVVQETDTGWMDGDDDEEELEDDLKKHMYAALNEEEEVTVFYGKAVTEVHHPKGLQDFVNYFPQDNPIAAARFCENLRRILLVPSSVENIHEDDDDDDELEAALETESQGSRADSTLFLATELIEKFKKRNRTNKQERHALQLERTMRGPEISTDFPDDDEGEAPSGQSSPKSARTPRLGTPATPTSRAGTPSTHASPSSPGARKRRGKGKGGAGSPKKAPAGLAPPSPRTPRHDAQLSPGRSGRSAAPDPMGLPEHVPAERARAASGASTTPPPAVLSSLS